MKNFSFYVSGNASRLKKFLDKNENSFLKNNIKFILIDNNDNKELRAICLDMNIDLYETDITERKEKNLFISDLFLFYLKQYDIDYGFIFADRILVGELLITYKNRLINFHPSILPSHKGLYAIDRAIKENTFLLGNTAHIISDKLDSGSIIMQNIFPSRNFKKYDDVLDKQLVMILQLMHWINEERLLIIDNEVIIKDASYQVDEFIPNIEIEL